MLLARSAFLAILALALIPAAAQAPRVAGADIQRIEIRAQAIEAFDPREPDAHALRRAEFRGGLVLEFAATRFRRLVGAARRGRRRAFPRGHRQGQLAARAHRLSRQGADRDRRCRDGADPRAGRQAAATAAAGTTPRRSPRTAASPMSASSASTRSCASTIAKDGLRARGRPIAVPPGMKLLPHNKSIECLEMAPKGGPLAGTLIAISERGLDSARQSAGLSDRRPDAGGGVFSLKRTDDFDVSDCAAAPDGNLLVLERRFSWTRGLAIRIRSVPLAAIKPGALVDGRELIVADMGSADRQHGRPVGAPRSRRRAGADADLRRQFLGAAADRCCCSSRWSESVRAKSAGRVAEVDSGT